MDEKKICFRGLCLLLLVVFSMRSFSQELLISELKWEFSDATASHLFHDRAQMLKWSKNQLPFSSISSTDIVIGTTNVSIVMVVGCSGIPCWNIFIFSEIEKVWHLVGRSTTRIKDQIEIEVDTIHDKIVFETKVGRIGELSFAALSQR